MYKEQDMIPPNQYFYDEAINFYQSGIIISNSNEKICGEHDLFSPILYLFCHSIELFFKALVIKCLLERNVINWVINATYGAFQVILPNMNYVQQGTVKEENEEYTSNHQYDTIMNYI